ncbi:MAG: hypothetical protein J0H82_05200 [Alphaproteobacteria bacterium]|nr:hypothetical protein [Alphaproteobacteria bacterium]
MKPEHNSHDALALFQRDAIDLFAARSKAIAVHGEGNTREAGDEVEIVARRLLATRFKHGAVVSHGHLVDSNFAVSPQLDFILSDPRLFPIWNIFQSGAEQVLYDSTHAIGEIKSSMQIQSVKTSLESFVEKIENVKTKLQRRQAGVEDKIGFGLGSNVLHIPPNADPYLNPLFTFMLIVSTKGINMKRLAKLYRSKPAKFLPNVLCMLDRGVVVSGQLTRVEPRGVDVRVTNINPIPEFDNLGHEASLEVNDWGDWIFLETQDKSKLGGASLMMLHGLLVNYLRRTTLARGYPNLLGLYPAHHIQSIDSL